jgi:hypothetical protein
MAIFWGAFLYRAQCDFALFRNHLALQDARDREPKLSSLVFTIVQG